MPTRPRNPALLWLGALVASAALLEPTPTQAHGIATNDPWRIDFRYAPAWWQTSICLPDDWQKTLVGKDGSLLYDYPGKFAGFGTRITAGLAGKPIWLRQELVSPRVPITHTFKSVSSVAIEETAFAVPSRPAFLHRRPGPRFGRIGPPARRTGPAPAPREADAGVRNREDVAAAARPPRYDVLLVRLRNTGRSEAAPVPTLTIDSQFGLTVEPDHRTVHIGTTTSLESVERFDVARHTSFGLVLRFPNTTIRPGHARALAFCVARGGSAPPLLRSVSQAERLEKAAERYWRGLDLPYGHFQVPDSGVQALLDSAIRNIYQAREIKRGLPAFQVGPTCYRGLWVVDGSFIMEAIAYLGRVQEARRGIEYLMSFQRKDGSFMLIDGHWKETGIALWAITHHARLTGDRQWLRQVWPQVECGVAFIRRLRAIASADPRARNAGLVPAGFSDGGLGGRVPEYTNVYWTLAGLRAAIAAARWLGRLEEAAAWQKEYDDFYRTFRKAAARDERTGPDGNRFLPIRMADNANVPPQKAQWAFLHAVFPGKLFAPDDPLVRGNLAMLRSVEREGLVLDTGWLKDGIWTYFGSFYAHAWLWLGEGNKAARTLYAFGNHASPLLAWREEQMPVGQGPQAVGDMPHNWASAEFIRLVRHLLVLERGDELHLFEGLPRAWVRPGAVIRLHDILTLLGTMSLELRVSADGRSARLKLRPPRRSSPARIVLHLDHWSGQVGARDLPVKPLVRETVRLIPDTGR